MGSFKTVIIMVIVILLLLIGIKQQIDINTLEDIIKTDKEELAEWKAKVERLEYYINMTDDEYLEKEAKEKFLDPDSQHFTNDYSN